MNPKHFLDQRGFLLKNEWQFDCNFIFAIAAFQHFLGANAAFQHVILLYGYCL